MRGLKIAFARTCKNFETRDAIAGFPCIVTYFLKRLVKIKIFEAPLVKLEFPQ